MLSKVGASNGVKIVLTRAYTFKSATRETFASREGHLVRPSGRAAYRSHRIYAQSTGFHSSASRPRSCSLPSKFISSNSRMLWSLSGGSERTSRFSRSRAEDDVLACGQNLLGGARRVDVDDQPVGTRLEVKDGRACPFWMDHLRRTCPMVISSFFATPFRPSWSQPNPDLPAQPAPSPREASLLCPRINGQYACTRIPCFSQYSTIGV